MGGWDSLTPIIGRVDPFCDADGLVLERAHQSHVCHGGCSNTCVQMLILNTLEQSKQVGPVSLFRIRLAHTNCRYLPVVVWRLTLRKHPDVLARGTVARVLSTVWQSRNTRTVTNHRKAPGRRYWKTIDEPLPWHSVFKVNTSIRYSRNRPPVGKIESAVNIYGNT